MKAQLTVKRFIIPLIILLIAFFSVDAHAVINNNNILDNVLENYQTAATAWAGTITARASWLFWSLATISMVWTFGMLALKKADIGDFYGEFIRFTVFTGFFWWLLSHGPTMATNIMNSMLTMGSTASGIAVGTSPSGIVDIGFSIFFTMIDNSSIMQPIDSATGIIISGIILVVLALIGVNMLLLLISGWILAYAGVFFLGFGGSRWTSDMAINYFKTVLNVGIQLLTMMLLVGVGQTFVNQYYNNMTTGTGMGIKEMGVMLVVSVVLLSLTNKVPALIGGIAMGGGTGALGQGFGAGSAMAATGVAAAAAATGGAAIAAGAANIAGGTQALMAAYQKASADNSSFGSGSSMSTGMADFNSSNSSRESNSQSPLAKAMGLTSSGGNSTGATISSPGKQGSSGGLTTAAKVAVDTGTNLAKGAGQVAKDKYESIKDAAQNRIDQTIGGQVAAAINNDMPSFSGDSLSGEEDNPAAEVAAFVNRSQNS